MQRQVRLRERERGTDVQMHRSRAQERDKGGEGVWSKACAASLSAASPGDASSHADHCKQRATASHPLLRSTHVPQSGAEAAEAGGGNLKAWFTSLKPVKMANIITPVLSCLRARAAAVSGRGGTTRTSICISPLAQLAWQVACQMACQVQAHHHQRGEREGGRTGWWRS